MDIAARISVAFVTTINAAVLAIVNGIAVALAALLIVLALGVDFLRIVVARSSETRWQQFRRMGRFLTFPRLGLWLVGFVVIALLFSYLALPEICSPALNNWIDANFSLARQRLAALGPSCEVPRGSVLLWSQAALPLILLLAFAVDALSSVIDPRRFARAYRFMIKEEPEKKTPDKIVLLFAIFLFFLIGQLALPFTPSEKLMVFPFYPQDSFLDFVVLLFMYLFPLLLFWVGLILSLIYSDRSYGRPAI